MYPWVRRKLESKIRKRLNTRTSVEVSDNGHKALPLSVLWRKRADSLAELRTMVNTVFEKYPGCTEVFACKEYHTRRALKLWVSFVITELEAQQ